MTELSILTLNIRRDRGDDGINNWEFRRDLIARILTRHDPDVAVFQEVLSHQLTDLISFLPEYEWAGVGRDDGAEGGEFSPIFYRGLTSARQGTFWMSDTPEVPSSTWPGMTRICTWLEFSRAASFALFNTHLEYQYVSTQLKSVDLLRQKTEFYSPEHPILLTGDFNFNPGTAPYKSLARFFRDSFPTFSPALETEDGNPATCHEFTGRTDSPPTGAGRIDYIWYRGAVAVTDFRILTDRSGAAPGVFPSDHWPVMCTIILESA